MKVEPRKYRFRILDGGPSRFYELTLHTTTPPSDNGKSDCDLRGEIPMIVIAGDGNFQPNPLLVRSLFFGVAQRCDIIIDFSEFADQDLYLVNVLDQTIGTGPSGREHDRETYHVDRYNSAKNSDGLEWFFHDLGIVKFEVCKKTADDHSTFPVAFREFPPVDLTEVRRERLWEFDFDGGLWTINGLTYDPNRIDAGIEQDTAEIWTLRNVGNSWSHPIHSHFTEFIILEINGVPQYQYTVQESKVKGQLPFFNRTRDFLPLHGKEGQKLREDFYKAFQGKETPQQRIQMQYNKLPQEAKDKVGDVKLQSLTSEDMTAKLLLVSNICHWEELVTAELEGLEELQAHENNGPGKELSMFLDEKRKEKRFYFAREALERYGSDDLKTDIQAFLAAPEISIEDLRLHSAADFRVLVVILRIMNIASLDLRNNNDSVKGNGRFMGGPRRDVALLLPDWEVTVFMRWKDFLGKHVMHCHNVVHEDHAMMIRWDIVPPGHGFDTPKQADRFYSTQLPHIKHVQPAPEHSTNHENDSDGPLKR
jgi:hypothetical protein